MTLRPRLMAAASTAAVILSLASCSPKPHSAPRESFSVELHQSPDGLFHAPDSPQPFSGEVLILNSSLTKIGSETYTNGQPHGLWLRFNTDGQIKKEDRYLHGELVHQRQWYDDGTRKQDAEMRQGIGYGKVRFWWPSGRLRRSSLIVDEMRPHGHTLEYAEDGTVLTDAIFEHGKYVSGLLREPEKLGLPHAQPTAAIPSEKLASPTTAQAH